MNGEVSVQWIDNKWTMIREDGTTDPVTGSDANILNTAIAYAAAGGWPLFLRSSRGRPFIVTNATIEWPTSGNAQNFVDARGCEFQINNTGAAANLPGHHIGTQAFGKFDWGGSVTRYVGNAPVVLMRPYDFYTFGTTTPWTRQNPFDFGTLIALGGNPEALLKLDVTARLGDPNNPADQVDTTGIADIVITMQGEGYLNADRGIYVPSPASFKQVGGEIIFNIPHLESCRINAIKFGDGSADDVNLGTHIVTGSIYGGNTANPIIDTNAAWGQYMLTACNNLNGGPNYNFRFGPNAHSNWVNCKQMIPGSSGTVLDQNADPSRPNQVNLSSFPSAAPPPNIGTSGAPFNQVISSGTWTNIDRSWSIPAGTNVTKLGFWSASSQTLPLAIYRRNSANNYTAVASVTVAHTGGSAWKDGALAASYTIPNDGFSYHVGAYTTGQSLNMVDFKDRAIYAGQIMGTQSGVTEEGSHVQWYVVPVRAVYQ